MTDPDAAASLADGLFGLGASPETAAVVVVPVPFQATTSFRRGTRNAPRKVLEASVQVDLHDRTLGDAWKAGIAMLPLPGIIEQLDRRVEADALAVIAAGGPGDSPELRRAAEAVDAASEVVAGYVERQVRPLLERGAIPSVLGGDHASPLGLFRSHEQSFGVLHIDAHADLRVAYEGFEQSHASIFHNALQLPTLSTLVQVGLRDVGHGEVEAIARDPRIHAFFDEDLAEGDWERWMRAILEPLPERVHVSLDIDGLDPALCPSTGTPVPGGLSWHRLVRLLRALERSGRRIVSFDLCEVGPGEWDAIVGSRVLFRLAGHAIRSQGLKDS